MCEHEWRVVYFGENNLLVTTPLRSIAPCLLATIHCLQLLTEAGPHKSFLYHKYTHTHTISFSVCFCMLHILSIGCEINFFRVICCWASQLLDVIFS